MAKRQLGKKLHLSGFLVFTAYSNDVKKLTFVSKYILLLVRLGLKYDWNLGMHELPY